MVAEPWILKMGNQVSSNSKHASYLGNLRKTLNRKHGFQERQIIGILSFEVANVMSKIIYLFNSVTDYEIIKLKHEILESTGIKALVSSDEIEILKLALFEKLDDLNRVASVVSRLGKKCSIPVLQGFEHVYRDIIDGVIDVKNLSFSVKDMDSVIRKMERLVSSTATLYSEMEVMNQLEISTKKFQQNKHEETWKVFEQKLLWKKQDVRHLMNVSLWNQIYDKVVELLARTVCTLYAHMYIVFEGACVKVDTSSASISAVQTGSGGSLYHVKEEIEQSSREFDADPRVQADECFTKSVSTVSNSLCHRLPVVKEGLEKRTMNSKPKVKLQKSGCLLGLEDLSFACRMGPGRMLMDCLSLSSSIPEVDDNVQSGQMLSYKNAEIGLKAEHSGNGVNFVHSNNDKLLLGDSRQCMGNFVNSTRFRGRNSLLVDCSPSTVGGSAVALRYANVIIIIEKLLHYPHLVGDEARDDLYQMLPSSLRKTLKTNLKSYVKSLAIYDAPLAHDWRERLHEMLKWLAPLAHNMITWQSERNVEQKRIITRTNVMLFQTLYFADREKTESAICELLVGLNYVCRYEQQQNALLDSASSFDFEDCMDWQLQFGVPIHH